MRARYYEPSTGRFISEDPARDGANWLVYCGNDPANFRDPDGRARTAEALVGAAVTTFLGYLISLALPNNGVIQIAAAVGLALVGEYYSLNDPIGRFTIAKSRALSSYVGKQMLAFQKMLESTFKGLPPPGAGMIVLLAAAAYAGILYGELFSQEMESWY
jgi:uncharacterized protein RhaS with RHS repeats